MKPPEYLDGAKVLLWDWSDDQPFGYVYYTHGAIASEIFGLAICQYEISKKVYRFSCNKDWEVEQDSDYDTIEDAIKNSPNQYKNILIKWKEYK
ncbi:hypothetical protein [Leptospira interrogans]|uniref:hypothetical protein n=1 Tax=Leptospira interrogans TaxID=173 RepID=UPI00035D5261|nr:hypothetical protein [Leptospira interrogans]